MLFAGVAELVDARDLKSLDLGHTGSSPVARTTLRLTASASHAPAFSLLHNGFARPVRGTDRGLCAFFLHVVGPLQEEIMGRGLILWLVGIPLPVILLLWVLGFLH